jgi:hypothetical protein
MKTRVDKELWLFNASTSDVSVSDLGIKVPAGESINVYTTNPYLTEEQVQKSQKYGALLRRLSGENPVLKVVQKKISNGKAKVRKIQESKEPITAIKTRSTVTIEQKVTEEVADDGGFDFADYGVDTSIAAPTKESVGVVIKAKEDAVEPVIMSRDDLANSTEKQTSPMGKMAEVVIPKNTFAVIKPAEKVVNTRQVIKEVRSQQSITRFDPDSQASSEKVIKYDDSAKKETVVKVVVPQTKEPVRIGRVETMQSGAKIEVAKVKSEDMAATKKDCGVVIENKSDVEFLDSLPAKPKEEGNMRIASRTKNGITVMKLK